MTLRELLLNTPKEEMSLAKTKFFEDFIQSGDLDMIKDPIFDIEWLTPVQITITTCVLMYLCYEVISPYGFTEYTDWVTEMEAPIVTESDDKILVPVRGETIRMISPAKTEWTHEFPSWFEDPRTFLPEKYVIVNRRGFLRKLKLPDSLPQYFIDRNLIIVPV